MTELQIKGKKAKETAIFLRKASSDKKNKVLIRAAALLLEKQADIIASNKIDLKNAADNGITGPLLDRLVLNKTRIEGMAEGLKEIAALADPVGEVLQMEKRPNGLIIGKQRVPIGVIGIIFESRPNVTVDAFGLCLKTGNASILRGGKEAIKTNLTLGKILQQALLENNFPAEAVQVIEDTSRDSARALMKLNEYLDLLIPRGGAGLIRSVVENSTVPVIETGVGNCHIYVDSSANLEKAAAICINAKTQRPGVCNAAESLVIHTDIAEQFIPLICEQLQAKNVEIRGDETVVNYFPEAKKATEEDWGTEYLDLIISMKVINSLDEAINHIGKYSTKHSESIITENYTNAQRFLNEVDSAAVYVNASTRFTDGYEFGFGAEIGISTQKLHARGPMGLKELTSTKYIIYGDGQIRE
ncbi:MAG: glutamate-5-semialdehyde dehydrogenase [Bacteroidetes bacterium]|nr:MAG: glutamate-5-semialdehyde dehydrogenase [Bacteroidota bacterium]